MARPGVVSARYAGPGATDATNNALLLGNLRGREDRRARFVCVIALANRGELIRTFRGVVEGEILEAAAGHRGVWVRSAVLLPAVRALVR